MHKLTTNIKQTISVFTLYCMEKHWLTIFKKEKREKPHAEKGMNIFLSEGPFAILVQHISEPISQLWQPHCLK